MILFILLEHVGDLGHARAAPGGPEIDQHHLAGERTLLERLAAQERALDLHRMPRQRKATQRAGEALGHRADLLVLALREDRPEGVVCRRGELLATGQVFKSAGKLHRQTGRLGVVRIDGEHVGRFLDERGAAVELAAREQLLGLGDKQKPLGFLGEFRRCAVDQRSGEGRHVGGGLLIAEPAEHHQALEFHLRRIFVQLLGGLHLGENFVGGLHRHGRDILQVGHHLRPRLGPHVALLQAVDELHQFLGGALRQRRHLRRRAGRCLGFHGGTGLTRQGVGGGDHEREREHNERKDERLSRMSVEHGCLADWKTLGN